MSPAGALPVALWALSPSRCFVSHLRSPESGDLLVLQGACVRWVLLGAWGWERGICKLPLSSLPPSQGVSPQGGGAGTRVVTHREQPCSGGPRGRFAAAKLELFPVTAPPPRLRLVLMALASGPLTEAGQRSAGTGTGYSCAAHIWGRMGTAASAPCPPALLSKVQMQLPIKTAPQCLTAPALHPPLQRPQLGGEGAAG